MYLLRREFLLGLTGVLGSALWTQSFPLRAWADTIVPRRLVIGSDNSLCSVDLNADTVKTVPLGFPPHSFVQNPLIPERVWAIQHWDVSESNFAAEVDINRQEVVRQIESPPGTQFYGHGVFSPSGDVLFIVRVNSETGEGHLVGYETADLKPVLDYQLTVGALHDCHMLPDHTLLVANYGGKITIPKGLPVKFGPMLEKSSLIRVDLQSGCELDRISIEEKDRIVTHFAVAKDGSIVTTGGHIDHSKSGGAIHFGQIGSPLLKRVALPSSTESSLTFGIQNVAMNEQKHIAAVSNQEGVLILFVDTRSGKFLGQMEQPKPHAISFDTVADKFICSCQGFLTTFDEHMDKAIPFSIGDGNDKESYDFNSAHSLLI